MSASEFLHEEVRAIRFLFDRGDISREEYQQKIREALKAADDASYREQMIDAGRGHQLR